MADLFFFPHQLFYKDENGDFQLLCECNTGKFSTNTDRELVIYKSLIFVPSSYKDIFTNNEKLVREGAEIQVKEPNGFLRVDGVIIRVSTEGLDDFRIWV